jgi:ABC-2 type transport system permease protein
MTPMPPHRGSTWRIPLLHLRIGVMNELQYRANLAVQLLQTVVQVATGLIALSLIFSKTDDLEGWTQPQLIVVLGLYSIVGGLIGFAIEPNMGRLMTDVRMGTFDYVLTKPVDAQLLASAREFRLWRLTDVVVGVGVTVWGVIQLPEGLTADRIAGFVFTITAGMILVYCIWLVVTTGAFWIVRMDMVQDLFTGMYRAGQYPVTVYPGWLRLTMTYLVPVGFAVTVPSESLTGRLTWERVVVGALFLAVALTITRVVWRFGTRRYAGASA